MATRLSCTLASLLFPLSCGALAQVSTTAQLNSLTYRLVDLDPNDGITPWATLDLVDTTGSVGTAWFDGFRSGGHAEWSESASGVVRAATRAHFKYSFSPFTELTLLLNATVSKTPSESNDSAGGLFYYTSFAYGDPTNYEGSRALEEYGIGERTREIWIPSREQPAYGELIVYTDAWARHSVPPVPEPSTWAMLSAGLLLLAGAGTRRRRWRS